MQIRNVTEGMGTEQQTRTLVAHEMRTPFGLIQTFCDLLVNLLRKQPEKDSLLREGNHFDVGLARVWI